MLKCDSYRRSSKRRISPHAPKSSSVFSLQMLALQCEHYEGEKLLCCQQKLNELERIQKRWLNASLQLFRRHPCPDGKPPGGQRDLGELDKVLSGLLERLDAQVSGENGKGPQL